MPAFLGTGATIAFSTGFFAEILSMEWSGIARESIDTTHAGTATWKTFMPASLSDPGELTVELHLDADTAAPINAAPETVTVTLPSNGAGNTSTWAAQGFMTAFSFSAPMEDKQTATATIKFTGAITVTP
jgi:hypothetical protein